MISSPGCDAGLQTHDERLMVSNLESVIPPCVRKSRHDHQLCVKISGARLSPSLAVDPLMCLESSQEEFFLVITDGFSCCSDVVVRAGGG